MNLLLHLCKFLGFFFQQVKAKLKLLEALLSKLQTTDEVWPLCFWWPLCSKTELLMGVRQSGRSSRRAVSSQTLRWQREEGVSRCQGDQPVLWRVVWNGHKECDSFVRHVVALTSCILLSVQSLIRLVYIEVHLYAHHLYIVEYFSH